MIGLGVILTMIVARILLPLGLMLLLGEWAHRRNVRYLHS
jgi:hypothetical protein